MRNTNFITNPLAQPIAVTSLKEQAMADAVTYFPSGRLSRFEIILVQEGHYDIEVNGYPLQLTTHTACFLIPGQFRLATIAENVKGFHISISEEYFHLTLNQGLQQFYHSNFLAHPWCCKLDKEKASLLELILSVIQREASARQGIILGWLKVLLEYFEWEHTEAFIEFPPRRDQEISRQFFKLLADHFTMQKRVSYYARSLSLTPSHLNQVIKRISGYTASYHIQRCIIMEAKRRALDGDKSMKEISYALGFDDISHFSKFFKNNTGVSFSSFKKLVDNQQ